MTAAPGSYAGRTKYDEPGRAARYAERSARRDREEWRLISRVLQGVPGAKSVLDVPCGTGRLAERFLALGVTVRGADASPAMRAEAEKSLSGRIGWLGANDFDLETSDPPSEWASDLVVCFRFLHHLPDEASRARVFSRLTPLARPYLLVSFHHPVSIHNASRSIQRLFSGRRGDRHSITLSRLTREAEAHGFRLVRAAALSRYLRDLWVALYEFGV